MTKLKLVMVGLAGLLALGVSLIPLATKSTPYIPNKGDVAAIDNGSDDSNPDCEHKETRRPPHPHRVAVAKLDQHWIDQRVSGHTVE